MAKKYLKYLKHIKKIMFVEDGSVDVDDLKDWAEAQGIKIITYRQGSIKPELRNLKKNNYD